MNKFMQKNNMKNNNKNKMIMNKAHLRNRAILF